jgi:site-specific DNA-methyltransferase (adenine-specific)
MQLIQGDCLEKMTDIPAQSIDLILCDLPYGTTACKWDTVIPFEPLWAQYKRIIKDHGAIVLTASQPFTSILTCSNLPMYRYDWYWQKDKGSNFLFGNKMPLKNIETISVFYKAQPTYNPQKTINPAGVSRKHLHRNPSKITSNVRDVMGDWKETIMDETQNYHGKDYEPDKLLPKSLIYFAREQRGKLHPTQKPVALMEYLIRTYTNEGDTVLDNCMGSGTCAIAALNTKRNFIGIEQDSTYFADASKRISDHISAMDTMLPL